MPTNFQFWPCQPRMLLPSWQMTTTTDICPFSFRSPIIWLVYRFDEFLDKESAHVPFTNYKTAPCREDGFWGVIRLPQARVWYRSKIVWKSTIAFYFLLVRGKTDRVMTSPLANFLSRVGFLLSLIIIMITTMLLCVIGFAQGAAQETKESLLLLSKPHVNRSRPPWSAPLFAVPVEG